LRLVVFYLRDSDLRGGDGDDKGVPLGGVEEVGEKHGLWLGEQDCEGQCADVKDLVGEEGGEKFFIIRRASPETVFASEVVVLVEPVVGFVGVLFIDLVDVVFVELDEAVGADFVALGAVGVEGVDEAVLVVDPEVVEHGALRVVGHEPDLPGLDVQVLAFEKFGQVLVLGGHVRLLEAEGGAEEVLFDLQVQVVPFII